MKVPGYPHRASRRVTDRGDDVMGSGDVADGRIEMENRRTVTQRFTRRVIDKRMTS